MESNPMLEAPTHASSLSNIASQHQLHKDRLDRIRKAAFKELTKPLPVELPELPVPVIYPAEPEKYFSISELIIRMACQRYNVRKHDIMSARRMGNIVKARHAIIVMLYQFTKWTTFRIADKIGRDPSNVFYVLQKQERHPIDFSELEKQIKERIPLIDARMT
jgi:chromosomal replication initiation ATPase DnaA